jgi:hypothetical protein
MKHSPRKKTAAPTPEEIRSRVEKLVDAYQMEWQYLVSGDETDWSRAICLHLQLCELEHMEAAMQEFV